MWVKIDDKMPEHPKVVAAGARLGRQGSGRVLAVWLACSCWVARQETDGVIPASILRGMTLYDRAPLQVAEAMAEPVTIAGKTRAGLLERLEDGSGYRLHDHHDYQPSRTQLEARRAKGLTRIQQFRARLAADQAGASGHPLCNGVTGDGVTPPVTLPVTPIVTLPPFPDPVPIPKPQERAPRAREGCVFTGRRLVLTIRQHAHLARMCGGVEVDLVGEAYPRWDAALDASQEPFQVLDWCEAQLKTELGIRRPATPTAADYAEAERIYHHVARGCSHNPLCPDRETCVGKTALRVMLHRIQPRAVRA